MRTVNSKKISEDLTLELERDSWNYARIRYIWKGQDNIGYLRIHARDRYVVCVSGNPTFGQVERDLLRDSGYIIPF